MKTTRTILAALSLAGASSIGAAACDAPEHRQFDFWVGNWDVTAADGKLAGTNAIAGEYGGCVIHERYTTGRGYAGESLNAWDADRKVWHQTWVDTAGTLLLLEGRLIGTAMVLEGAGIDEGKAIRHRITWTPNADGTVRQHWETTSGTTGTGGPWKTVFDGLYRRKPS